MKLVKEHINEKFMQDSDAIEDMGIGTKHLIEKWLEKYKIENYKINDYYMVDVDGSVDLELKLTKEQPALPEYIQFGIIRGFFDIKSNRLKTLKGCPKYVTGFFSCADNLLTSLKYAPSYIGGDFNCSNNKLKTLKYAPKEVLRNFKCKFNKSFFSREYILSVCKCDINLIQN